MKIFKDISNFEIDHEKEDENPKAKIGFKEEIRKISNFLSFDILNYVKLNDEKVKPLSCLG